MFLLPKELSQRDKENLKECQWGEFIHEKTVGWHTTGPDKDKPIVKITRYKCPTDYYYRLRSRCRTIANRPLRAESATQRLGDLWEEQ